MVFDSRNKKLFVGFSDEIIKIWDFSEKFGEQFQTIKLVYFDLWSLCIDPEEQRLFIGINNGGIWVFKNDEKSGKFEKISSIRAEKYCHITALVYVQKYKLLISGSDNGVVAVWWYHEEKEIFKKVGKYLWHQPYRVTTLKYDDMRDILTSLSYNDYKGKSKICRILINFDKNYL